MSSLPVTFVIHAKPTGKMRHQTVVTLRCSNPACQKVSRGQRAECPYCGGKNMAFVFSNEFSPKEQKSYEQFAAMCAQQGMRGREKFTGPTRVECQFFFEIPKSRVKKLKEGDWHMQRPDTDNCVKSVWDAMNKICFTDDCVVVQMTAEKRWTTGIPRTEVVISDLAEGAPEGRTEAEQEATV